MEMAVVGGDCKGYWDALKQKLVRARVIILLTQTLYRHCKNAVMRLGHCTSDKRK